MDEPGLGIDWLGHVATPGQADLHFTRLFCLGVDCCQESSIHHCLFVQSDQIVGISSDHDMAVWTPSRMHPPIVGISVPRMLTTTTTIGATITNNRGNYSMQ